jgi:hypothetical protein
MLEHYLGPGRRLPLRGGHRLMVLRLRAEGRYVQIHDPDAFRIALLGPGGDVDPERDVFTIEQRPLIGEP